LKRALGIVVRGIALNVLTSKPSRSFLTALLSVDLRLTFSRSPVVPIE
jgi:hypothetical protein